MKKYRFQFQVSNVLIATFWVAVMFSCFAIIQRLHQARVGSPYENPLTVVMMVAPFPAIAALFGRAWVGVVVGAAAIGVFFFLFYLF